MNKYREGKVKSTPDRGVKKYLKPCAYKRLEPRFIGVTACLLHNEPTSYTLPARLSISRYATEAKASLNRATQSVGIDAKPGDLPMVRLKSR